MLTEQALGCHTLTVTGRLKLSGAAVTQGCPQAFWDREGSRDGLSPSRGQEREAVVPFWSIPGHRQNLALKTAMLKIELI